MQVKINWFGLVGGITTIIVIISSLFIPWWQLTVGDSLAKANVSPLNTNFDLIGNSFTIPLIWAINLGSILYLAAAGIVMLIYSVKPTKLYSKRLLGFSYRKPLYYSVFFVVGIVAFTLIVNSIFKLSIPVIGSAKAALPSSMTQGININVMLSSTFLWPFWLAVVSAGFCIAARFYHTKINPTTLSAIAPTASVPSTSAAT